MLWVGQILLFGQTGLQTNWLFGEAGIFQKRTCYFGLGWLRGSNFIFSFMGYIHIEETLVDLEKNNAVGGWILPNRLAWHDLRPDSCKEACTVWQQFSFEIHKPAEKQRSCHGTLWDSACYFCTALCIYKHWMSRVHAFSQAMETL